jgi:hypothetical protein
MGNNSYTHWQECKLVQSLWKSVWRCLKKLKIVLVYDIGIPLLGMYLKECKLAYNRDTCTPMFVEVLLTVAKLWNQPRCPSADEWIKKKYTMEYNLEERNYVIFRKMDRTGNHLKWNKPDWERQVLHVLPHMQNLDLKNWTMTQV